MMKEYYITYDPMQALLHGTIDVCDARTGGVFQISEIRREKPTDTYFLLIPEKNLFFLRPEDTALATEIFEKQIARKGLTPAEEKNVREAREEYILSGKGLCSRTINFFQKKFVPAALRNN